MKTRDLAEYLSGRAKLTENHTSNSASAPLWTGRQERLQQNWRDATVKLEALFLDVLDASEAVYGECLPLLKDVRGSDGESCWENIPRFRALLAILQRSIPEGDHWARYASHMAELLEDLEWMCDQLAPKDDTVPEKPPKDKEDWQAEKDADTMGAPPPSKTFKPANESKAPLALPPICPSLVMASLGRAADLAEASSKVPAFRLAGDAIRLSMETYTDVGSASIEEGLQVPGGNPRLDLVCEWDGTVGKANLHWKETAEGRGLVVEGSDTDFIEVEDGLTDAMVAERIYHCLNTKVDTSPRRVWEAARVVPELYRLIERHASGEIVPKYRFEEALDALSLRMGIHESVRLTADQLTLHMTESVDTLYGYYWDWEQRYGEPAFNGDPDNGEPLPSGPLSTKFQTAELLINLPEKKVTIRDADGNEEDVPPDMTDEDASARLLSLGQQRESSYHLGDEWESNFRATLGEGFRLGAGDYLPASHQIVKDLPKDELAGAKRTAQGFRAKGQDMAILVLHRNDDPDEVQAVPYSKDDPSDLQPWLRRGYLILKESDAEDEEVQIAQMGPEEAKKKLDPETEEKIRILYSRMLQSQNDYQKRQYQREIDNLRGLDEADPLEAFEPETVLGESAWNEIKEAMLIDEDAISFDPAKHPRDDAGQFIKIKHASRSQKGAAKTAAKKRAEIRGHKPMTTKELDTAVQAKKDAAAGIKSVKGEEKPEPKAPYKANRAAKRAAAKKAKKGKIPAATKAGEPIHDPDAEKKELPAGAVEQPADTQTGEVDPRGYAGWKQDEEPAPEQKAAAQVAAPPQEPTIPQEQPAAAVEDPGPADRGTPPAAQSTTPPEQQQTFQPSTTPPEPKVKQKPQKSDVSRFNPDLDQIFGDPAQQPPQAEPKRPEVPDAPSAPVDLQGAPKEEPSQEPDVTAQAPDAAKPAPTAPPPGFEDLAEPVSPSYQPEYRRPPEELGNMSEEEFAAARNYIYAQADQALQSGNWDAADPAVQNVRVQAERDVDDMMRAMQEEANEGGTEFAGLSPDAREGAVREKMRARLEAEADKLLQRQSERKDEVAALEKEYSEKIVGFVGSLIGSTWDEMSGLYSKWQSTAQSTAEV